MHNQYYLSFSLRRKTNVMVLLATALLGLSVLSACGPKPGESINEVYVEAGTIYIIVNARMDTVMQSANQVLVQERIALRRYEPQRGIAETGFFDLADYPAFFDRNLWDDTERLIKLHFEASIKDKTTIFTCVPLYNPTEVITSEIDYARLRRVPPGHPGFDIAVALTRRIAAHAEGRVVTAPS